MRRFGLCGALLGGILFCGIHAEAESSLDALEKDLDQVKQEHDEADSQTMQTFLDQLEAASQSPTAALNLYQNAGGQMPNATPVTKQNVNETPDEKAARLAQDQANNSILAAQLQAHCALMRFAGLFIVQTDQKGLHNEWLSWLKSAAQTYPNLQPEPEATKPAEPRNNGNGGGNNGGGNKRRNRQGNGAGGGGGGGGHQGGGPDFRDIAVRDSDISKYLQFHAWGDKEQGQWKIKDLPSLYRKEILDPLRASLSPDVLAAWDTYIAMKSADQTDRDKWDDIEYPALLFDRDSDDFALGRTQEKLETLADIITKNKTHPQFNDWQKRAKQMIQDLKKQQAGAPPPSTSTATTTPDKS